jgi:hypothetical protein
MDMETKKQFMEYWKNVISYCNRCSSTILWDEFARPVLLNHGNDNLEICLDNGCECVYTHVPELCAQVADLDLLILALAQSGVPKQHAESAALKLTRVSVAA